MSIVNFLMRRRSAAVARDRLKILLEHERAESQVDSHLLAVLREEVLAVISRHVEVDRDRVKVVSTRGQQVSRLEIDVEIPARARLRVAVGA